MTEKQFTTERTEGTEKKPDGLTDKVIAAAIQVHRELGPGLLESTYETCLALELAQSGLKVERQKPMPIRYRETLVDSGIRRLAN